MARSPSHPSDRLPGPLDDPEAARRWLEGLGVGDAERGYRDLRDLAARGVQAEAMTGLLGQLGAVLPVCPDPVMALTNLERFVAAGPSAGATVAALVGDPRATEA